MELDHGVAELAAKSYFGTETPLTRLGWGIGGHVYLSPDFSSAVKIHRRVEGFRTEVETYKRLQRHKLTSIHGLTIPTMRGFDVPLKAIEMSLVTPPYLLDFAGVTFKPPDFSEDVMQDWRDKLDEMFGANSHIAHRVHHSLAGYGIFYMDFRPSNMNLEGLPGLAPPEPSDDDDEW